MNFYVQTELVKISYRKLWSFAAAAVTPLAVVPAMAAAAVAAEVAAIEVTLDDDEDSCMISFEDLNRLWPASLKKHGNSFFNLKNLDGV